MKYLRKFFITVALIFFSIVTFASDITFLTHSIKPFSYEQDGEIKGFAVTLVREMMREVGQPEDFRMFPFKRGLVMVQNQPGHALFITARRPEREDTVKWVGPLIESGVYFYKKRGRDLQAETLADLKNNVTIGVAIGNADHVYLEAQGFKNLSTLTSQTKTLDLLSRNRLDVTPVSEIVMPELAKEAGIDVNLIERTNIKLYDSTLFLAFSKTTPDAVIQEWQEALDLLKSSGRYQEIYNQFIQ